jgi:hypothetical protein
MATRLKSSVATAGNVVVEAEILSSFIYFGNAAQKNPTDPVATQSPHRNLRLSFPECVRRKKDYCDVAADTESPAAGGAT